MKLSDYVVIKKIKNHYVIFSTISKTIIKVNSKFYHELKNIGTIELNEISLENLEFLKDNFFVVENGVDERDIVDYVMNKDRLHQQIFSSYIAFSTICNFACVYCYEEGQTKRNYIMDECTLNEVINWYERTINNNNYREVNICLFGGEPLVHKNLIKKFVKKISYVIDRTKVKLSFSMVTNGYLLDNDIIQFLNKYNLSEIQITIDGVGKTHDNRRPLKNGGETFDTIINNIVSAEKFNGRFLFRVSFDKSNSDEVKELLKYLKKLKIQNNYLVYLAPIHNTTSQECSNCSFCSTNIYEDQDIIIQKYKELYLYMKNIGFDLPKFYTNGPCMTVSNDTSLIDPHGDLYKCVEMISLKDTCVGNVRNRKYNSNYYTFTGNPAYYNCIKNKCKYVCLCGGGCIMSKYLRKKAFKEVDCQYKYFEELIPFFLEENYYE